MKTYQKTLAELTQEVPKNEGHKTPLPPEMIDLTVDLALKVWPWSSKDMPFVYGIFSERTSSPMTGLYFTLVFVLASLRWATAKGKNKKMLTRYLNCRISVAPRHLSGTEFMLALLDDMYHDLTAAWPYPHSSRT